MPDLSQPPPPLLANFQSLASAPPPPPPLPPPPPPSSIVDKEKLKKIEKERLKDRNKRGLPNLRDKHICSNYLNISLIFHKLKLNVCKI